MLSTSFAGYLNRRLQKYSEGRRAVLGHTGGLVRFFVAVCDAVRMHEQQRQVFLELRILLLYRIATGLRRALRHLAQAQRRIQRLACSISFTRSRRTKASSIKVQFQWEGRLRRYALTSLQN
jgi:hypothetical protein